MTTTLAPTVVALAPSKDNAEVLIEKMRKLIPNAEDAPNTIVLQAAHLVLAYDLDPFTNGEVQLYCRSSNTKDAKNWLAHIGVAGYRKIAHRQARYVVEFEDMTPEEVKEYRGKDYAPEDRGSRCTLYRLDYARDCKEIGIPYKGTVATGFYRKKAFYNKYAKPNGEWKPDIIPNCRETIDVAQRRAESAAIQKAFAISTVAISMKEVSYQIDSWEQDQHIQNALPIQEELQYENDGGILYA